MDSLRKSEGGDDDGSSSGEDELHTDRSSRKTSNTRDGSLEDGELHTDSSQLARAQSKAQSRQHAGDRTPSRRRRSLSAVCFGAASASSRRSRSSRRSQNADHDEGGASKPSDEKPSDDKTPDERPSEDDLEF
eukprot:3755813-Prymnesium_polylepis.3